MISSKIKKGLALSTFDKLSVNLSKGFTMIELLIVIAVLGILAVAVLSAINPIEQINRSRDTGSRSDAEQLISAVDRFYASKGYYPWAADADSTNTDLDFVEISATDQAFGTDTEPMLENLSSAGSEELKSSFIERIVTGNLLSIGNEGDQGSSTYVCFVPKSASFRDEAWIRCTGTLPDDFPAEACPADGTCTGAGSTEDATGCFICLP